jgi:hypothetical protein
MEARLARAFLFVSGPDDDKKHERTGVRVLAFGYFVIGWGLAYWFWPDDLGSSGAILHALASGLIGVAATVLAGILW